MAFLVCYSRSAPHDHTQQVAIYLDQDFYKLIFQNCITDRSHYANLSVIASLRYKSPHLVVSDENLESLAAELEELQLSGHAHPQLAELGRACAHAITEGCSLSITGDMHPEL